MTTCYKFLSLLVTSLLITQFTIAQTTLNESHYRIWSTKFEKEVSLQDIANDMKDYDVLFFGEEHNDSVTHFLEHKMLTTLHATYGDGIALSLEMFDRDVQGVMNEYLDGIIREKHFTKDARAWSNYRDYKPMIEFAKEKSLDVVCANSPTRYTNLAGRKGQEALQDLPASTQKYFAPLPYDTASGAYYEKLTGISLHATPAPSNDTAKAKPPTMSMPGFNMIMAQSLWDATMAYSIYEYLKQNKKMKILQVNGKFHSDEHFAIVTQLENYNPRLKSLVISTASDEDFPNIKWSDYKNEGDYIIITDPKVPRTYKD